MKACNVLIMYTCVWVYKNPSRTLQKLFTRKIFLMTQFAFVLTNILLPFSLQHSSFIIIFNMGVKTCVCVSAFAFLISGVTNNFNNIIDTHHHHRVICMYVHVCDVYRQS